jgi:hypothetical protein
MHVGVMKQLKKKVMAMGEVAQETILATTIAGMLP